MRAILIALALTAIAASASAADGDFKTGTFTGFRCNYAATFEVQTKKAGAWRFDGKITIKRTGEYDRLKVQQKEDNSLEITRYLSGRNTGKSQRVLTYPPEMTTAWMVFGHFTSSGIGCGPGAVTTLKVPY